METFFGKPLNEVKFDDVVEFCNKQYKESIYLDYKQDLSGKKSIVKTICSFANTVGGWLIIGVEDDNDKPKAPYIGIEHTPQLASAISNMIVDTVWPYFRPVVHVCEPDANNKTFILAYIPESAEAPHWTGDKSLLYVRRNDRSVSGDWERYATADEWEWLRDKRSRAINQRETSSRTLGTVYAHLHNRNFPILATGRTTAHDNRLNIFISPFFPSTQLLNGVEAYELIQELSFSTAGSGQFPTYLLSRTTFDNGGYTYSLDETTRKNEAFFGVENYGGILANRELVRSSATGSKHIIYHEFMNTLEATLEFAASFYSKKEFYGLIGLEVEISSSPDLRIIFRGAAGQTINREENKNVTGQFQYAVRIDNEDITDKNKRYETLREVARALMRSFGYTDTPDSVIDEGFERLTQGTDLE